MPRTRSLHTKSGCWPEITIGPLKPRSHGNMAEKYLGMSDKDRDGVFGGCMRQKHDHLMWALSPYQGPDAPIPPVSWGDVRAMLRCWGQEDAAGLDRR